MKVNSNFRFMRVAIEEARRGMLNGKGGPFGACIVRWGRVIAKSHNTVLKTNNPSLHAEINAIGIASRKLGTPHLSGCEIYSTTEPCPMCFAACHWAQLDKVFYGSSIADVARLGFNELTISNKTMKRLGRSPLLISNGICKIECLDLLKAWNNMPSRRTY